MAFVKNDFAMALKQVAAERGIQPEDVISSIEAALLAAYTKEYPENAEKELIASIDKVTGEARIFEYEKDITPPGFGRIAAQTARNVVAQKMREVERKTAVSHFQALVGSAIKGRIIRSDSYNGNIYVDLNRTEAVLPRFEQLKTERYTPNTEFTFLLKSIEEDKTGRTRIILSRTNAELASALFKREVPEIGTGNVKIMAVAREAGERTKIAVLSSRQGVDPVGACVGQRGVRVQVVTEEIGRTEKIDIIQWHDDPKLLITAALAPAKVESIDIDETSKMATVHVASDQAPLAIGRGGSNVNLASKLTGYTIDISSPDKEQPAPQSAGDEVDTSTNEPESSNSEESAS